MNSKTISSTFIVLAIIGGVVSVIPAAFAQYGNPSDGMPTATITSGNMAMTLIEGMSTDGSTKVTVDTTPAMPVSGQPLSISLTFTDANGNPIKHQNYAIDVTQDGNSILSNVTGHTHTGNDMQMTSNLVSANPVDIKITLNGMGLPGTDPSTWTGPKGDVVNFHVVPEFGSIVPIVLAIAVISIVVFTAKTRIPKL
jgi:predicted secreted protein with PEFG-CTERM motif